MSTIFISKTHLEEETGRLRVTGPTLNLDGFNKLRTSSPRTQFDYQNQYNAGDIIWSSKNLGTGTYTHQSDSSTVLLATGGTASGAGVYRQTRQYLRYTSGISLQTVVTLNFRKAIRNVRKRGGYFDNKNGIYLQEFGGTVSLVLRSSSSGTIFERIIPQSKWEIDKMDGKGPSGIKIDWTKSQIFPNDIQWLGVGTLRCGFEINGKLHYVHNFENANITDSTYMTTANLPIRYEIENVGVAEEAASMLQICSTVISEGNSGDSSGYYTHTASTKTTPRAITTRTAVLTIRPKLLFNSITNRTRVLLYDLDVICSTNDIHWELVWNTTVGGTPSWTSVSDNSPVEFDRVGTTATGGEVAHSGTAIAGFAYGRGNNVNEAITAQYPFALDIDGANPAGFSLVATPFTGTANVTVTMNFKEYY